MKTAETLLKVLKKSLNFAQTCLYVPWTDVAGIEISVVDVRVIDGIENDGTSADVCMPHGAEIQGSSDVQMDNVTYDFNDNVDDLKEK